MRFLLVLMLSISLYGGHVNVAYGNTSLNEFSKIDTMITMDLWVSEMFKESKDTVSFHFYDDTQKMAEDFHDKKLDYVVSFALDFVKYFDKSQLIDGVSGGMQQLSADNLVLVVAKETSQEMFNSLKNPKIALKKRDDIANLYVDYLVLKNEGIQKATLLEVKKRNAALLNLFFKKIDAAVVTQKTFDFAKELNPQIAKKLKILYTTDLSGAAFGYFRKDFDSQLRETVIQKAFQINETERGKNMMRIFQTDAVVAIKLEYLEPIELFYKEYLHLKKKHKNEK